MRKQQKARLVAEKDGKGVGGRSTERQEDTPYPVTLEDVVVAIPSHLATEAQLKAGRSARLVLSSYFLHRKPAQFILSIHDKTQKVFLRHCLESRRKGFCLCPSCPIAGHYG